jgi:hypothetical protein
MASRRLIEREQAKPLPITRSTRTYPLTARLEVKERDITAIGFTAAITIPEDEDE